MENIFIGVSINSNKSIIRYRILELDTNTIRDIHTRSISKYLNSRGVRNLKLDYEKVIVSEGSMDRYPHILLQGNKVINNVPIVISVGDRVVMCNYLGKVISLDKTQIIGKGYTYANAIEQSGSIKIEEIGNQKVQEGSRYDRSGYDRSGYDRSGYDRSGYDSIIKQIVNGEWKLEDIHDFDMSKVYNKFGVGNDPIKEESLVFSKRNEKKLPGEYRESAIKLQIRKVEDRVELCGVKVEDDYTGEIRVPNGTTHINERAFASIKCYGVYLPDTVKYIGNEAFKGAKIYRVRLPKGVTVIPRECFYGSTVKEINLEGVRTIGPRAFYNSYIEKIDIKSELNSIGEEAFAGCKVLTDVKLPKSLQKISKAAFKDTISLGHIDLSNVEYVEKGILYNSGVAKVVIGGEVKRIQSETIVGAIREVELLPGVQRLDKECIKNTDKRAIVWIVPDSVKNISSELFKQKDTVICNRNTVANIIAIQSGANVIFKDAYDNTVVMRRLMKAKALGIDFERDLRELMGQILTGEDADDRISIEIDESKVFKATIPEWALEFIGEEFRFGEPASRSDIGEERNKFKAILKHLYSVSTPFIEPFTNRVEKFKDTFYVSELIKLYGDPKSSVFKITFTDKMYKDINSSFIVAKTKDTVRYMCACTKFTDLYCETYKSTSYAKAISIIAIGDSLGENTVLSGELIEGLVTNVNGGVYTLYDVMKYGAITIKGEGNEIWMILPANNKVIKCNNIGSKSTKSNDDNKRGSTIQGHIQGIYTFDSGEAFKTTGRKESSKHGKLIEKLRDITDNMVESYILGYKYLNVAEVSPVYEIAKYIEENHIRKIEEMDIAMVIKLLNLEFIESRDSTWLDDCIYKNKSVVPRRVQSINLKSGHRINQYKTMDKTNIKNKILHGGKREIYVYELVEGGSGYRLGVYLSDKELSEILEFAILATRYSKECPVQIMSDPEKVEFIRKSEILELSAMGKGNDITFNIGKRSKSYISTSIIFGVYKPNGKYYFWGKIDNYKYIPILQIGNLDVALSIVEDSNKSIVRCAALNYLVLAMVYIKSLYSGGRELISSEAYDAIVKARMLTIEGINDVKAYEATGILRELIYSIGVNVSDKTRLVERSMHIEDETEEIDEDELNKELEYLLDDIDDVDIDDEDIGDIEIDI